MAPGIRSRVGGLLASVKFALAFLLAALRDRPLRLRPFRPGMPSGALTPAGRFLFSISGAAEGDDEDDDKPADDEDDDPDDQGEADKTDDEDDDDNRVDPEDDWKRKSRKNETRAKKAEREAKEARDALVKREEADQSESEKAVKAAEKKGREDAETKAEKERKQDRLEVAATRIAAKKLKLGEGDDAEEVRFADPEDALMHVERAIAQGEIDEDDIFDDQGMVNTDALQKELAELLERKPHLRETGGTERTAKKKPGDNDARKGEAAEDDLSTLSVDDHVKRKYGENKK